MVTEPHDAVAKFRASLAEAKPPSGLSGSIAALWWAAKGDWEKAHKLVQDDGGKDAAWVHAYLHRVEGDLANAGYWYRRAGQEPLTSALEREWTEIAARLLDKAD